MVDGEEMIRNQGEVNIQHADNSVGGDNDDDKDDDDVDDWIEHAVSSGDLWQDTVLGPDLAAQEVDKGVQGT